MTTPTLKEKRFCEKNGINFPDIDIDDLYRAMRESDRKKWKAYSKQYYQQNSEQVKSAMQKHRELHRDEILEKRKSYAQQDFVCGCGCTIKEIILARI